MQYILTVKFHCDDERMAYKLGGLAYSMIYNNRFVRDDAWSEWKVEKVEPEKALTP